MNNALTTTATEFLSSKSKITKTTFKSFLTKFEGNIYVNQKSEFDGMTDGIESRNGGFVLTAKGTGTHSEADCGYTGIWLVDGSRNWYKIYNEGGFVGIEVSNCCGRFIVAVADQPAKQEPVAPVEEAAQIQAAVEEDIEAGTKAFEYLQANFSTAVFSYEITDVLVVDGEPSLVNRKAIPQNVNVVLCNAIKVHLSAPGFVPAVADVNEPVVHTQAPVNAEGEAMLEEARREFPEIVSLYGLTRFEEEEGRISFSCTNPPPTRETVALRSHLSTFLVLYRAEHNRGVKQPATNRTDYTAAIQEAMPGEFVDCGITSVLFEAGILKVDSPFGVPNIYEDRFICIIKAIRSIEQGEEITRDEALTYFRHSSFCQAVIFQTKKTRIERRISNITKRPFLLETFDNGGFDIYVNAPTNGIAETIKFFIESSNKN